MGVCGNWGKWHCETLPQVPEVKIIEGIEIPSVPCNIMMSLTRSDDMVSYDAPTAPLSGVGDQSTGIRSCPLQQAVLWGPC